ncbi:MAG: sulfite exporter TauE/SafE family protein [Gammaproteobacteria bacterium]
MTEILISPYFIAVVFFAVALAYSSVGLGGASSYTALLAIAGVQAAAIPMVSLTLNLLVTSVGSYNFIRRRHANFRLLAPFLIASVPMAYLGGALQLPQEYFFLLLLVALVFAAARIYFWKDTGFRLSYGNSGRIVISLLAGSVLGVVAGVTGIGGGIFLVPLIIILGLGTVKEAAACGAIFVWLNSLAGLVSRLQYNAIDLLDYAPLMLAVILGGMLGSSLGSHRLSRNAMEKILGIIILLAIVFLARRLLSM